MNVQVGFSTLVRQSTLVWNSFVKIKTSLFQEPSQMDDDSDDLSAYSPLMYWSAESFDIDLRSYGKSTAANYNNNNTKKDKNDTKKLVAEFLQRRSALFHNVSKHRVDVSFLFNAMTVASICQFPHFHW